MPGDVLPKTEIGLTNYRLDVQPESANTDPPAEFAESAACGNWSSQQ
jgi:hypothetical protein